MRKAHHQTDPLYDINETGINEAIIGFLGSLLLIGLAAWNLSTYTG